MKEKNHQALREVEVEKDKLIKKHQDRSSGEYSMLKIGLIGGTLSLVLFVLSVLMLNMNIIVGSINSKNLPQALADIGSTDIGTGVYAEFNGTSGAVTISSSSKGTIDKEKLLSFYVLCGNSNIRLINFTNEVFAPTEDSSELFRDLKNLTSIENIEKLDITNATNVNRMFSGCQKLKSLNLKNWNMTNIITNTNMLAECISLEDIITPDNLSDAVNIYLPNPYRDISKPGIITTYNYIKKENFPQSTHIFYGIFVKFDADAAEPYVLEQYKEDLKVKTYTNSQLVAFGDNKTEILPVTSSSPSRVAILWDQTQLTNQKLKFLGWTSYRDTLVGVPYIDKNFNLGDITYTAVFEDESIEKYTLELVKKGETENKPLLKDAQYKLTGANVGTGIKSQYTTDDNGKIIIEKLVLNEEYVLTQVKAGLGYQLDAEPIKFKAIKENGIVKLKVISGTITTINEFEGSTVKVEIEDKALLRLRKVDSKNNDEGLQGAKFTVKDASNNYAKDVNGNYIGVEETINGSKMRVVTSDENGWITQTVQPGTYQVTEVQAPIGYNLPPERTKTLKIEITSEAKLAGKEEWKGELNTPSNDIIERVVLTQDGGRAFVGSFGAITGEGSVSANQGDNVIGKYNEDSKLVWSERFSTTEGYGQFNNIKTTSDGGLIAIANKGVIKYMPDGEGYTKVWQSTVTENKDNKTISYLVLTEDDGFILTMRSDKEAVKLIDVTPNKTITKESGVTTNIIVLKYKKSTTSNGYEVEWDSVIKSNAASTNLSVTGIVASENGMMIVGWCNGNIILADGKGTLSGSTKHSFIVKYNKNSNGAGYTTAWGKRITGGISHPTGVAETKSHEYVMTAFLGTGATINLPYNTGNKTMTSKGSNDGIIIRFSNDGQITGHEQIGGTGNELLNHVVSTSDGGYVVAGSVASFNVALSNGDKISTKGGKDALIIKYDKDSQIQWYNLYGGANDDYFSSVYIDENDNILLGGLTKSGTAKLNNGEVICPTASATNQDAFILYLKEEIVEPEKVSVQEGLIQDDQITFNITTAVDGEEGGTITGNGQTPFEEVGYGETSAKDIVITPADGYGIESITVNNQPYEGDYDSEDRSITLNKFSNVLENTHVVVKFVENKPKITPAIKKAGTEVMDIENKKVDYTITYKAVIQNGLGNATITITDTLPFNINTTNSILDGGIYNATSKTITWTEEIANINTYQNGNKEIEIEKNITVYFDEIDYTEKTFKNIVNSQIEIQGVTKETSAEATTKFGAKIETDKLMATENNRDNFVTEGEKITYTIKIKNDGGTEKRVPISDMIPEGTTYVANSVELNKNGNKTTYQDSTIKNKNIPEGEDGISINTATGSETISEIIGAVTVGAKEEASISFVVSVNELPEGQYTRDIKNKATVDGKETKETVTVVKKANIVARKEVNKTEAVKVGDILTYDIILENTGTLAGTARISDIIPEKTTYVANSTSLTKNDVKTTYQDSEIINKQISEGTDGISLSTSENNTTITGLLGNITLEESAIAKLSFQVTLNNSAENGESIVNTADVNGKQITAESKVIKPIIAVNKTITQINGKADRLDFVTKEDTITYMIIATNTGDLEGTALIKDTISNKAELVANSIQINGVEQTGKTATDLENGISITIPEKTATNAGETTLTYTVKVKENAEGDVINKAKWIEENETQEKETAEVKIPIVKFEKQAEAIRKTQETQNIPEGTVTAGDQISYTVKIINTGSKAVTNLTVKDEIATDTETIVTTVQNGNINENQEITWQIENLNAGESKDITFTVKVNYDKDEKEIKNTAYINNRATNETSITYKKPEGKITTTLEKTTEKVNGADKKITNTDDPVYYEIKHTANIQDFVGKAEIKIVDKLPYAIDLDNSELAGGTYNQEDKTITWTETVENVNTYENSNKEITRNKAITLKYIYTDEENLHGKIKNIAESVTNLKEETEDIVKSDTKQAEYEVTAEIPTKVIVHHYKENTEVKLVPDIEITGIIGNEYTTTKSENIEAKYEVVSETPEKYTGTMTKTTIEVCYYYRLKDASVIVHHYIEGTKNPVPLAEEGKFAEDVTITGQVDDTYEAEALDTIAEYYEVVNSTPEKYTGTMTTAPIEVTYEYRLKKYDYTVNYLEKVTNIKLAESKQGAETTWGETINSVNEKIDITGYNYDSVSPEQLVINTTGNEINVYYTKRNDLKYTVKYLEVDDTADDYTDNNKIADDKVVEGQEFEKVIQSEKEAIQIDGFNYAYCKPETITLGLDETKNIIVIYYTRVTGLSYTVNYLEKGTNEKLQEPNIVGEKQFGDKVNAIDEKIDIAGYNYDSISTEELEIGTNLENNVINIYYTKRTDLSYTVNYLEKVEGEADKVLADAKVVEGQTFKATVTENAIEISGYDKVAPTEQSITIEVENNVINFYYSKRTDLTYTVNYLEKAETEGESDTVVAEAKVVSGQTYKSKVTESAIEIAGYNKVAPTEKTITIEVENNIINFYYTKRTDLSYTVNYLEKDTDIKVAETKTIGNQTLKATVAETAIEVSGYNKVAPTEVTITIEAENNEINFYYTKRNDLSYVVNYLEKDTDNVLANQKLVNGQTYKSSVTENAIEISGYDKEEPTEKEITIEVSNNVINFYYTKRTDLSYTVNYLEQDTNNVVAEAKTVENQTYKSEATETAIEVEGYNKVEPTEQTITIEAENNEINFYYTKRTDLSYTVNYLEKVEGEADKVLAEAKIVAGQTFKANVTETAIDIVGYDAEEPAEKTITIEVENNVINFYYTKRTDLGYTVNYLEKTEDEAVIVLAEPKIVDGQTYKSVVTENAIDIAGYNKEEPIEKTITIEIENNEINFYYTKRTDLSYTVNYLEKAEVEGEADIVLAEPKEVGGQTFKSEATETAIEISGYNKVEPTEKTIIIEAENNEINFYYTRRTDLSYTVNYLEQDTNKVLAEPKEVTGQTYKSSITEEAIDIAGYNAIEPAEQTIIIEIENNVINFYYTKRTDLSYIVNYLEKPEIEGEADKVLAEPKEVTGQTYKSNVTETAIEIAGYNKVEPTEQSITIEAENNIINFYYTKRNDLSYIVNYLEKAEVEGEADIVLAEAKVVGGQTYKSEATETAIEIVGYNVVEPAEQTITIEAENNIINFYYTKRNDLSYIVNYLEKAEIEGEADKVLAEPKNVEGQTYLSNITETAINIAGYYVVEPAEQTITIDLENNIINFYYEKRTDLRYKVKFLEKDDTLENDEDNKELAEPKTITGQKFEKLILSEKEVIDINGYNYDYCKPQVLKISANEEENVIIVYYTKVKGLSYRVNYLEKDTNKVLYPSNKVGEQEVGNIIAATDEKIEIYGYIFESIDKETLEISEEEDKNVINIYYVKKNNLSYVVNYLEKVEGKEDKVLAEQKQVNGQTYLSKVTEEAIDIKGYNKPKQTTQTITIEVENNVINFYYTKCKDLSYVVNYLEKIEGQEDKVLAEQKKVDGVTYLDEITENAIDIYGYDKPENTAQTITIDTENNIINFYYTKRKDLSYVVNYLEKVEDEADKVLAEQKQVSGQTYLSSVTEEAIDIKGYNKPEETTQTIIIDVENNEINFYYTKRTDLSYTVNYLEKSTDEDEADIILAEQKQVDGVAYLAEITEEAIDIEGYNKPEETTQTITIDVENNEINFYYTKRNDLTYTVNYLEKGTNKELHTPKLVENVEFKAEIESLQEIITINGYQYDSSDKEILVIGVEENVINIFYTKVEDFSYTVKYIEKDTNKVLHSPKTVGGILAETVIVAEDEKIEIRGYIYDSSSVESITIGEETNEIILYYTKRVDFSYTVNYLEKDTEKQLHESKISDHMAFEQKVIAKKEIIEIDGYNYDSVNKEILIIDIEDNIINIYYTKRNDLSYTVNYLEKGTNEVIHEAKTVENVTFETEILPEELVIPIYGYNFSSADKEKLVIQTGENTITLFYEKKDAKVTVHYYEENTTNTVADSKEITGKVFDEYKTAEPETIESKYELVGVPENATGTMTEEDITVIYYYRKKPAQVIVHHYAEGTTNKVSENVIINGKIDDKYETKPATDIPDKYELSITPENAIGIMTEEPIELTYYYRVKDSKVIIKYLEKDTNIELAQEEIQTGKVEEEYTTGAKTIEGYTLVGDSGNTEGILTIEPTTVIFYYLQNTKVIVNHIDKNSTKVLHTLEQKGLVGDEYTSVSKNFDGYILIDKPSQETVIMAKNEITLNYYYARVNEGIIEKHIDVISGEILNNTVHEGYEGKEYNILAKEFDKYDVVKEKLPQNSNGTMGMDLIEVAYYYHHRSNVTAKYIDRITGKPIAPDTTINGHEQDNYSTERKALDGYVLTKIPENADGKMTKEDITVTYVYAHLTGGVIERHIDINTGKQLVIEQKFEGYEGDSYKTEAENIPYYDLVKEKMPTNAEGTMTIEQIVVNYYYAKQSSITIKYIDKTTGKPLAIEETISGHEGDKYETSAREILGYAVAIEPENKVGTIPAEPIEIVYEYARAAKVIVSYIDTETNRTIAEADLINGYDGQDYETIGKEIRFYKLEESKLPANSKGTMKVEIAGSTISNTTYVNYYYRKLKFDLTVDKLIKDVTLNGKTIAINSDLGKVEMHRKEIGTSTLQIRYTIKVTNSGEITGKAKLLEKIPAGSKMTKENNPGWNISNTTATLETEDIKPGETKEYIVVLDWVNSEANIGTQKNIVEILSTSNEAGFIDSNKDDNVDGAELIISVSTGETTYIAIMGTVLVILAGAVIVIKRKNRN